MSSKKCNMHTPMEFNTPGVPPNPLPFWSDFSFIQKLPVPSRPPKGTVVLFNTKLGHSRWLEKPAVEFDLTDPNNYNYPAIKEYDSRCDRNLRSYFTSRRVIRHLRSHGRVNPDGTVTCSLYDYNRYRFYLHSLELRALKTKRGCMGLEDLPSDSSAPIYGRDKLRAVLVRIAKKEKTKGKKQKKYSGVLRREVPSIVADNDQKLIEHLARKGYPAGELRWLRWLNRILQEDCRKIALMRVRRIQKYGEMERKKWNDWRRRNLFDMEWLAEERVKNHDIEIERLLHVREHMLYAKDQNAKMADIVKGPKPCHLRAPWEKRGLLLGEIDLKEVPSDQELANAIEKAHRDHIECLEKAAARRARGLGDDDKLTAASESSLPPYHRTAHRAGSLLSLLTEHIVINALDIIARTRKEHGHHLERVDPDIDADKIIGPIEFAVSSEMECLASDEPDVLLMIADRITATVMSEKTSRDKLADWDSAPQLKASSSKTGLYVANTIAEVFGQLKDEGLLTADMRELAADSSVARGATEVSLHSHVDDVASLRNGDAMLDLAVGVLREKHKTLPGGDDEENWKELGAGLIASLVRIAIVKVRDALQQGHVGDTDLSVLVRTMEAAADVPSAGLPDEKHHPRDDDHDDGSAARKMATHGNLVTSESISRMISDAVHCVAAESDKAHVDGAVKEHIAHAALQFVTKIIDDVFADGKKSDHC